MFKFFQNFLKPIKVERELVLDQTTEGVSKPFKINLKHSDFNEVSVLVEGLIHPDSVLVQVSNNGKSWYNVGTDIRTNGWHEYPIIANWVRVYKVGSFGRVKVTLVG